MILGQKRDHSIHHQGKSQLQDVRSIIRGTRYGEKHRDEMKVGVVTINWFFIRFCSRFNRGTVINVCRCSHLHQMMISFHFPTSISIMCTTIIMRLKSNDHHEI